MAFQIYSLFFSFI